MIDRDKFISSAREIAEDIVGSGNPAVSYRLVCEYLRSNSDLKFKKQKKVPLHANSLRNQYMRQQFALKMLQLLFEGKRILACDETWFGETNYYR